MVTDPVGSVAGAVYKPLPLIVPIPEVPQVAPVAPVVVVQTAQVTPEELLGPCTVALNWNDCPVPIVAVEGVTMTLYCDSMMT